MSRVRDQIERQRFRERKRVKEREYLNKKFNLIQKNSLEETPNPRYSKLSTVSSGAYYWTNYIAYPFVSLHEHNL